MSSLLSSHGGSRLVPAVQQLKSPKCRLILIHKFTELMINVSNYLTKKDFSKKTPEKMISFSHFLPRVPRRALSKLAFSLFFKLA